MKKLLVIALVTSVLLSACKKEGSTTNAGIEGTYNFKYLTANTTVSIVSSSGRSMDTYSQYTTTDNGGTLIFNNGNLTGKDLTYAAKTQARAYEYDRGKLLDSLIYPVNFNFPRSNSTGQYKIVGSDSIYFIKGGLTVPVDGSSPITQMGSGGRFSFKGNQLTITQVLFKDSSFRDGGQTFKMTRAVLGSIVLEKQ